MVFVIEYGEVFLKDTLPGVNGFFPLDDLILV